jgi:hypothetical protein
MLRSAGFAWRAERNPGIRTSDVIASPHAV